MLAVASVSEVEQKMLPRKFSDFLRKNFSEESPFPFKRRNLLAAMGLMCNPAHCSTPDRC